MIYIKFSLNDASLMTFSRWINDAGACTNADKQLATCAPNNLEVLSGTREQRLERESVEQDDCLQSELRSYAERYGAY